MIIVNPNHANPSPQAAIEPPIWCAYLAAYYKEKGLLPEVFDAEAESLSVDETAERIGQEYVVLVAMGANPSASSTPKMTVIEKIRGKFNRPLGVVGLHPQAMGDEHLSIPPSPQELCGLTPAWDLIDFSKYRAHNWHCLDGSDRSNYGVIYTSFGCPFNCYYCNIHAIYKTRKVAFRKPEDVLAEIDCLVKVKGIRNLKIADELFVLNKSHINAICDGLIERNYGLNIWAYARVDTVSPGLLTQLKKAGISWLVYGFESGDGKVLDGVGKGQTMKRMFEAAEMTREAGINILGNFIFGLPKDNMATMNATANLSKQLKCDWVNYYCAMAYPGSQLYEDIPKENLPANWSDYDQFSRSAKPLPTEFLSGEEVLAFRDKRFNRFFTNDIYQARIKDKFGQQAVEHIKEMLEWKPRANEIPSSVASSK